MGVKASTFNKAFGTGSSSATESKRHHVACCIINKVRFEITGRVRFQIRSIGLVLQINSNSLDFSKIAKFAVLFKEI